MTKRRYTRWYFLLTAIVLILFGSYFAAEYTDSRHKAALARIELPESVERFLEESAALHAAASEGAESSLVDAETQSTLNRIAKFEQLLEYQETELKDNPSFSEFKDILSDASKGWTDSQYEDLRVFLEEHADFLKEIQDLFESAGLLENSFDEFGFPSNHKIYMPLQDMRDLLQLNARLCAYDGNWEACVDNLIQLSNMSISVNEDPNLIAKMISFVIENHLIKTVQDTILTESLEPEVYARLIAQLNQPRQSDTIANALIYESSMIIQRIQAVPIDPSEFSNGLGTLFFRSPVGRVITNLDIENTIEWNLKLIEALQKPYEEAVVRLNELQVEREEMPFYMPLSSIVTPSYGENRLQRQFVHDANYELLRLGLAVEYHNAIHGNYPESFDDVSQVLGGLPSDPFGNGPFHYSTTETGYSLYSIGRDWVDSGGDAENDIVWQKVNSGT